MKQNSYIKTEILKHSLTQFQVFANLEHLDHIGLSSNHFTNIDPDTFSEAVQLKKLCLNRNPIVIPEDGPLLNLPELEELNLSKCNISELNSHTFSNLVELQSLDLSGNLLEDVSREW